MKKVSIFLLAMVVALGMAVAAQAQVVNTIYISAPDNPGIPPAKCYQASKIVLAFNGGTTFGEGDVGYFDLSTGVTLCQDIDFFVGNVSAGNNLVASIPAATQYGPLMLVTGTTAGSMGGVYMRVQGYAGDARVQVTIIGVTAGTGNDFITLAGTANVTAATLTLFDRGIYSGVNGATQYAAGAASTTLFLDDTGDNVPDTPMRTPPSTNKNDANAMCIITPATYTTDVRAFFASVDAQTQVSKWTFTDNDTFASGQNNISVAHVVGTEAYSCVLCKADSWGYHEMAGVQSNVCTFDYNSAGNYCTGVGSGETTVGFMGNSVTIEKAAGTFSAGDYQVVIEIDGLGTYWMQAGAGVNGLIPGVAAPAICTTPGTSVVTGTSYQLANGTAPTATDMGDCDVASGARVVRVVMNLGSISSYSRLRIAFPAFLYNLADVAHGQSVSVKVYFYRRPCIEEPLLECSQKVVEYCTACPAAGARMLVLPYFTPRDDTDWWGGVAFTNTDSTSDTLTLTVYELDGDIGTKTVDIAAQGNDGCMVVMLVQGTGGLYDGLTPDATNLGTLGDSRFALVASFSSIAAGKLHSFTMIGHWSYYWGMGYIKSTMP